MLRCNSPIADVAPQSFTGCLRGDNVDDQVPEPLQWEDQGRGVVETEVHLVWLS